MPVETLIDKEDGFEQVRDRIALILAEETISQQALAVTAGKDPELWKLRVFRERYAAIEEFLNVTTAKIEANTFDESPVVDVRYNTSSFETASSNVVERQTANGVFYIDCYAVGIGSGNTTLNTQVPSDVNAALNLARCLRLVRNMLMGGRYTYLGFERGALVSRRWPRSIQTYAPEIDSRTGVTILGGRVELAVRFNELSPQEVPTTLEILSSMAFNEDGQIIATAEFDYT